MMTSNSDGPRPPFLVLGLGNSLLSDDGVGPALIEQLLQDADEWKGRTEFLDGGTQGLALLGHLSGRKAIVIVDALSTGAPPGTTKVLDDSKVFQMRSQRAGTAHEGNALELLAVAEMLGEMPDRLFIVGVEPQSLAPGCGLSQPVRSALPLAAHRVIEILTGLKAA